MRNCYLEVTYRNCQALTACYYLPRRDDDRSVPTECLEDGLIVDFTSDGRPIGIEITSRSRLRLATLSAVLQRRRLQTVRAEVLLPLAAA